MATTVARLEAILHANTRDFDHAMDRSEGRMKSIGKTAGVAGLAIAGGIAYGLEKSVHAAIDAQVVNARLAVAFKNVGLNVERYTKQLDKADAAGRRRGFTDEETKKSIGSLITATKSYRESVKELAVAQDLARFKSVDLETATRALTMLHAGSTRALKQLGIQTDKVTVAEDNVKLAFKKHTGAAYDAAIATAKLQDKHETLLKTLDLVTKRVHGQADAFSNTAAGGMEQFKAQIAHIEVAIGEKLLPVITMAITYIRDHWPEITATIQHAWAQIKPTIVALGDLVVSVVTLIRSHWSTIGPIVEQVVNIVKAQLAIISGVIKFFAALLRGDWSGAWKALKQVVVGAFDEIRAYLTAIKDVVVALMKGIGTAAWKGLKAGLEAGLDDIKNAVEGLFGKVIGWAEHALGIKSPSTVFHGIGQNVVKGFINGVGSMAGDLKEVVLRLAEHAAQHLAHLPGRVAGAVLGGGGGVARGGDSLAKAGDAVIGSSHEPVVKQVADAVGWAASHGWHGSVTSGFRSYAEQSALYQTYLAGGPLAAKPGTSSHETGQAVDVTDPSGFAAALRNAPAYAKIFNRLGSADPVHFSVSGYDQGGWLKPGLTMALNNTGRPERVVPPGGDNITIPISLGGEHIATVVFDMLRRKAKVFEKNNGRLAFGG